MAKLLGGFILFGLEALELGFGLFEPAQAGLFLSAGIGVALNNKPLLFPTVGMSIFCLSAQGLEDGETLADLRLLELAFVELFDSDGPWLLGWVQGRTTQLIRSFSGHGEREQTAAAFPVDGGPGAQSSGLAVSRVDKLDMTDGFGRLAPGRDIKGIVGGVSREGLAP